MKKDDDKLGEGIVIGLTYGLGITVFAFFKNSIWGLFGIPLFITAYYLHNKALGKKW